jgi:predicted nucleic acid-binding protein
MNKVFADANILVAVLNKEYPLFSSAARLLSLAERPNFTVYTSPVCLAIAFYFAQKKCGERKALEKIRVLSTKVEITSCGSKEVISAASNPRISDFEDGLEYYAALHAGCEAIITEDLDDFHFSDLPVLRCEDYLRNHVIKQIA